MKIINLIGKDASGKNTVAEIMLRNATANGLKAEESGILTGSRSHISKEVARLKKMFEADGVDLAIFRIHNPETDLSIQLEGYFSNRTLQSIFSQVEENVSATH